MTTPHEAPESLRLRQMVAVREEVLACTQCEHLIPGIKHKVFGVGNVSSSIVLVGEAPGEDEDACGFPFVGKAGKMLDQLLYLAGLRRDRIFICNALKCRAWKEGSGGKPSNRTPRDDEIRACRPFLGQQLRIIQPKVVVGMGNVALSTLRGVPLKDARITQARGMTESSGTAWYLWTFHPSYINHRGDDPAIIDEVVNHLKRAKELAA